MGKHPLISPHARFDVFAYSIGSFLSEILMMANPCNYFQGIEIIYFLRWADARPYVAEFEIYTRQ